MYIKIKGCVNLNFQTSIKSELPKGKSHYALGVVLIPRKEIGKCHISIAELDSIGVRVIGFDKDDPNYFYCKLPKDWKMSSSGTHIKDSAGHIRIIIDSDLSDPDKPIPRTRIIHQLSIEVEEEYDKFVGTVINVCVEIYRGHPQTSVVLARTEMEIWLGQRYPDWRSAKYYWDIEIPRYS